MLIEPQRTHIRYSFFSSPSDVMKSTVVDESLSTTTTRVLFQKEITYVLQETTELEIYTKFYLNNMGGKNCDYSRTGKDFN